MMKEQNKKIIKEITEKMKCSKNFSCVESGFENLCKARGFGSDNYLECLEADSLDCEFTLPFGNGLLCKCPARVAIAKVLKE